MPAPSDLLTRRDDEDREWAELTGFGWDADPIVILLVIPQSSGASVQAQTTYRCSVQELTNEEVEGADLVTVATGRELLAVGIGTVRPTLGQDLCPVLKIGDRLILLNY